jgi:hypothetical protein
MTEQLREIVTAYLILNGDTPVIFSSDEEKVNDIVAKATKKNISLKKRKITTNKERILEIGKNFFERKIPEAALKNPIEFRNKLILELHATVDRLSDLIKVDAALSWVKIRARHNVDECTVNEFSQWMFDINEFIKN